MPGGAGAAGAPAVGPRTGQRGRKRKAPPEDESGASAGEGEREDQQEPAVDAAVKPEG